MSGAGTAPWAGGQVERFAPLGLAQLIDRWNETSPQVETIGGAFPPQATAQFVFDACTHEHDIRGALGYPGARNAASVIVGLTFIEHALAGVVADNQLPGIELDSPGFGTAIGAEPAAVRLSTSTFELFRVFGGRRSEDQIRDLPWQGDPTPNLTFFGDGPIQPPTQPLVG
jgi:hypothetical protein